MLEDEQIYLHCQLSLLSWLMFWVPSAGHNLVRWQSTGSRRWLGKPVTREVRENGACCSKLTINLVNKSG